jgi:hypothetical protein
MMHDWMGGGMGGGMIWGMGAAGLTADSDLSRPPVPR